MELLCKPCSETKQKRKRKARYVLTKLDVVGQPILNKGTIPVCAECAGHIRSLVKQFPKIYNEVRIALAERKKGKN